MSELPNPVLGDRFIAALDLTVRTHAEQGRKQTEIPYLGHLLAVCSLVIEAGGSEDEAIAALLHDAVEDGGGAPMLKRIRDEFGENVAAIVDACSDTDQEPKPPWLERKKQYLVHLEDADGQTLRVSCADKLHNVSSIVRDHGIIGAKIWTRFSATREQTIWYYQSLAEIFSRKMPGSALSRGLSLMTSQLDGLD
jgi:(p)ppGpp synthase/HD superfamily hydrolase